MTSIGEDLTDVILNSLDLCCICRKKGVEIHHIDGNRDNFYLDNLAPLCEHHRDRFEKDLKCGETGNRRLSPTMIKCLRDLLYIDMMNKPDLITERNKPDQEIPLTLFCLVDKLKGEGDQK